MSAMQREMIELVGSVEIAEDVQNRIKTVGVRGLDFDKANELGVFKRISNLLCISHAAVMAAYRIYGGAASIINDMNARRNEISKAMNDFEKAFMKFVGFWTSYYAREDSGVEVNREHENLYHRLMEWAQLPEKWSLGDAQRVEDDYDVAIRVEHDGDILYFKITELSCDNQECEEMSWCVTKYNKKHMKQETVEKEMDKASAMMVAKRLSEEDKNNIYTASVIQKRKEEKTVLVPFRTYYTGKTNGKKTKLQK